MRQLTAPGGAIPAARFWTRSLSEYRGAPRLPRGATSVGDRGAPRLRRGATSVGGYGGPFRGPPMSLVEHHRIAGGAGGANDPQRRPDERALEDLLVDERLGVDVLQVPDAPAGLHLRVAGHREVGPLLPRGLRVARS